MRSVNTRTGAPLIHGSFLIQVLSAMLTARPRRRENSLSLHGGAEVGLRPVENRGS